MGRPHRAHRAERRPRRARDPRVFGPARAGALRADRHRFPRRPVARDGGGGDRAELVAPSRARHDATARRRDRVAPIARLTTTRRYARTMLGFGGTGAGAIVGLLIGIGLSVYVAV